MPSFGRVGYVAVSETEVALPDGLVWQFDVPKAAKKTAQGVTRALGGTFS